MERLIFLLIWVIGITILKNANTKNNSKTKNRTTTQNRKSVFGTLVEELEKEKQRMERPARSTQLARPSLVSNTPKPNAPSKPKAPPEPIGLEIDIIGGDEEIGGINEANISLSPKYNNLNLDIKRDVFKGIIYSEILSEPKGIRNMKRRY